ncbi:mucin-5AC-like isoform X2 [Penaeus indicus]|uniref:mucin-5AC-like isoform X2 n=1 Tax=Penaeus indicus TaxID=29960 RepID=UPI00300C9E52
MFINHLKKVQCNRSERLDDPGMALIFSLVIILAVSSFSDSKNVALDTSSLSKAHPPDVKEVTQDEPSTTLFTNITDTSAAVNTSQNPATSSAVVSATSTSDGTSVTSIAPSSPNATDSTTSATTKMSTAQPTSSPSTTSQAPQTTSTPTKPTSPTTPATKTTSALTTSVISSSSPDVTSTPLKSTTGIPPTPITTTTQPSTTTVPPEPPHPGLSVALSLFILLAVILIIGAGVWWIRRRRQLERLRHQLMPMYNFDPTDDADDWENQLLEEERSLRPEAEKVQMYSGNSTFDTSQKAPAGATQKD